MVPDGVSLESGRAAQPLAKGIDIGRPSAIKPAEPLGGPSIPRKAGSGGLDSNSSLRPRGRPIGLSRADRGSGVTGVIDGTPRAIGLAEARSGSKGTGLAGEVDEEERVGLGPGEAPLGYCRALEANTMVDERSLKERASWGAAPGGRSFRRIGVPSNTRAIGDLAWLGLRPRGMGVLCLRRAGGDVNSAVSVGEWAPNAGGGAGAGLVSSEAWGAGNDGDGGDGGLWPLVAIENLGRAGRDRDAVGGGNGAPGAFSGAGA